MRAPLGKTYGPQRLAFPDGVAAQFDVTYQILQGFRPLTLDLYQPRPRGYPLPLLVFVHGGTDTRHAAAIEDFPAALADLAAQGYVVASVNYRLSGEARFPAALQDVKSAIRWLRARGNEYNIDTTRVAVWGFSGGAHLAALARPGRSAEGDAFSGLSDDIFPGHGALVGDGALCRPGAGRQAHLGRSGQHRGPDVLRRCGRDPRAGHTGVRENPARHHGVL
jgi:hypothetical protein